MTIEIKSRWDSTLLYSADVESTREALEKAVAARANLAGANLAGANLDGAYLAGAYLAGAYLAGAYLAGANLAGAYLDGANLDGANLARANLDGANLAGANLAGANLAGANLAGANLDGAYLAGAYLDGAYLAGAYLAGANLAGAYLAGARNFDLDLWLKPVRDDIREVLNAAPGEVPGLLAKLWAGEVDGTAYEGECACLVGTIANLRGCTYNAIPGLKPNSDRPSERWFYRILKGHTPVNSPSAAFAAAVIAQWQSERANAKPKKARRAPAPQGGEKP